MMMMPQRNRLSFKKLSKTDFSQHVATTTMHIMMHVSDKSFETKQRQIGSIPEADCFNSFTTECDIQVLGIFHFFGGIGKNGTGNKSRNRTDFCRQNLGILKIYNGHWYRLDTSTGFFSSFSMVVVEPVEENFIPEKVSEPVSVNLVPKKYRYRY